MPTVQPRLLSRSDAAAALGIGITKLKELIAAGELGTVSIHRRRLIPVDELDSFVARLRDEGRSPS